MEKNGIYNFLKLGTGGPICSENIVFLLGAGASRDAGIPTLAELIDSFEKEIYKVEPNNADKVDPNETDNDAQRKLYNYFKEKSRINNYSLGSSANIEDMLAIMEDFLHIHQERSVMYDLVGSWDKELTEIFQSDFKKIIALKDRLKKHVTTTLSGKSRGVHSLNLDYFHFIFYLQKQLGGVLKIFTLNHDCCVEEAYRQYHNKQYGHLTGDVADTLIETGFGDEIEASGSYKEKRNFDIDSFDVDKKCIKLYKLHGSIDWKKVEGGIEHTTKHEDSEIIFGISQKYKSEEPYSLLYPEFKRALSGKVEKDKTDISNNVQKQGCAKLLVVVGYSFHDPHINDAIVAAMRKNKELKILICDPGLIETFYFLLPQTSATQGQRDVDFIKKIISSEDYEVYINMSVVLHSVYYSRNFDEDALFLSACIDKARNGQHLLQKTNSARSEKEEQEAIMILENIFRLEETEIRKVKAYFQNPRTPQRKEERNATIYDDILETGVPYKDIANCIDEVKVEIYRIQKEIDIKKRTTTGEGMSFVTETQAALELIDDLRMIEKFIKDFIPVHLSLMVGLIEQYQKTAEGNERVNLRMNVFEMYLKYNYLIDAIEIKIIRMGKKKLPEETEKAIYQILGEDYCKTFRALAGEGKQNGIIEKLEKINAFLKSIKNRFLTNNLPASLKNHPLINKIVDENNDVEFQDVFLSWKKEILDAGIHDDDDNQNLNRILYNPQGVERLTQLKIMLYSKGLAKSMVDRFSHAERLLHDLESMIKIVLNEESKEKTRSRVNEFFSALEMDIHASPKYAYKTKGQSYDQILKLLQGDFWTTTGVCSVLAHEVNNKVPVNLNWYVTRFFKLQKEMTDALFTVRFNLPEKGIDYWKNMQVYAHVFNKWKDNGWVDLQNKVDQDGSSAFYQEVTWKAIDKLFGRDDGTSCLDRISFCHFPAKIFFTKTLRPYTLFRAYYSVFYAEEHLRYFCDIIV